MKTVNLQEKLRPDSVFLDLDVNDRFELIRVVSEKLGGMNEVIDSSLLAVDACQREEELSTGIDRGIAMPHARTNAVSDLICAFARPSHPVDFNSSDGHACDIVFFSAVPRKFVDQYLHFTAAIVRKLQRQDVVDSLRQATSAAEILQALGIHS